MICHGIAQNQLIVWLNAGAASDHQLNCPLSKHFLFRVLKINVSIPFADKHNDIKRSCPKFFRYTPFLIANRHLFTSDRQIALVSSAGISLRQRSPHIDIVHLYKARGIENRHSAPCWHWSQNLGYWMSMPKLNAPVEIHWRRSNMNTRDPILMKSVEVLKDCRSLNAAAEMNCPMPRSVEKVPIRNEKRCMKHQQSNGNSVQISWDTTEQRIHSSKLLLLRNRPGNYQSPTAVCSLGWSVFFEVRNFFAPNPRICEVPRENPLGKFIFESVNIYRCSMTLNFC